MMFLHLVDDEKFTDGSIELFESCDPGNHRYVIIRGSSDSTSRYVKSPRVEYIEKDSPEYDALCNALEGFTAVFVYSLFNRYHLDMVNRAPERAVLVWFFGGGELLTTKKYWKTMMLPLTRRLYYKHQVVPWVQRNLRKYTHMVRTGRFGELIRPIRKLSSHRSVPCGSPLRTNMREAIARFDYVAPVIPEDLEQLRSMTECNAKFLSWNYPMEGFSLDQMEDWHVTGNNWLIGNAARYALNHIDLMNRLRKIEHGGHLIVPLSYGDNEHYRDDVLRIGAKWFGPRFCPIVEFKPVMEYIALISSCSAAFFNTKRQHAIGNVLFMLHLGSKVFLRDENPVYHFLKTKGAIVFSIQTELSAILSRRDIDKPLDEESLRKNRDIVGQIISAEAFTERTDNVLSVLKKQTGGGRTA